MKNKVEILIAQIEQMNEMFYQQKNSEGYTKLDQVLALLIQIIEEIYQYHFEDYSATHDKIEINNIFIKAMKAIEVKDTVLIADIFQHELIAKLIKIKDYIQ
jgi:hypothetical protein